MELSIIRVGDLLLEACEGPDLPVYNQKLEFGCTGASTVTLIRGEKTLLVDTGFGKESDTTTTNEEKNHRKLELALFQEGVTPQDVDCVFFTHLHRDHTGNYGLFEKATFFMSADEYRRCDISNSECVKDGDEIMDQVFVFSTPGHTRGHYSVRVELGDTVVIAGDAIVSLSYLLKGKFWCYNRDYYSDEASRKSVEKILDVADYIIPGHGPIFQNANIDLFS